MNGKNDTYKFDAAAALKAAREDENNIFLSLCCDEAVVENAADHGGPLCGAPVAVKDNIAVKGCKMTCGSKMLESFVPCEDAFVVEKMRRAGMVIIGKTNLDEFAMGSSGLLSAFGAVKNPHSPDRYAGGSSSGSAAAVASGIVPVALGSDTGGSVRVPAAYCGVAAYKPTWGAVSRRGMVAHASSLDTVGIIGADAKLCAQLMAVISGRDEGDDTSFDLDIPVSGNGRDLAGLCVGVWTEQMDAALPEARAAVETVCSALRLSGASVIDISCPAYDLAAQAYIALSASEAASCLGRFDGLRYGADANDGEGVEQLRGRLFGPEVRARLVLGSALLGFEEYAPIIDGARRRRTQIKAEMERLFCDVDLVIGPTVIGCAPRIGEKRSARRERLADAFAAVANLAGIPALTLPCGSSEVMPLAVQIMGAHGADELVLSAGIGIEKAIRGING